LKVVLVIVGLLFVLAVASVLGLVYVAKKYGPGLMEAGKHSMDEGHKYGRSTDNEGCVNEVVARHKRISGLGDMISNGLFFRGCLDASRPTPGFCDDVPTRLEFMKSARWQLDECKRHGLSPESQCGQLFQQVQQFCEERGRKLTPVSPEEGEDGDADDSGPPAPPPAPPPPAPPSSR
jgi:hypothetical protein